MSYATYALVLLVQAFKLLFVSFASDHGFNGFYFIVNPADVVLEA